MSALLEVRDLTVGLQLESGRREVITRRTVYELRRARERGHVLKVLPPYGAGGAAYLIARDPETGVLQGGSDPRSEGLALGI